MCASRRSPPVTTHIKPSMMHLILTKIGTPFVEPGAELDRSHRGQLSSARLNKSPTL